MRNPPAVRRAAHVLLVDMIGREVAGDAGEQVNVAVAYRLGEADLVADGQVEVAHASCSRGSPVGPVGQPTARRAA